jgi:hypothetical protein
MTVAASGRTVTNTRTTTVEQQVEWQPRPSESNWWQARQNPDALVGWLLACSPTRARVALGTRPGGGPDPAPGLARMSVWGNVAGPLAGSGADTAGFDWADLARGVSRLGLITATNCAAGC